MGWVSACRTLGVVAVGLIPSVTMADFDVGVGLDIAKDLPDPGLDLPKSQMGLGVVLRGPVRLGLGRNVGLRADPLFGISGGHDRVEWKEYDGLVPYHSDDHWTLLTQLGVVMGPELRPWPDLPAVPYIGTGLGGVWARHWHSFDGPAASVLNPADEGLSKGGHIDPYSDQFAAMVAVQGGVRLPDVAPFAIEVEAGYNVAFMSSARLRKARPGIGAVRTAYGLNLLRFGVNAVFPLGKGKEP